MAEHLSPQIQQQVQQVLNNVVDNVMMVRLANKGLAIIRKRTLAGEFLPGSSPGADQYSTTPMPLPFGKFNKMTQQKVGISLRTGDGGFRLFTNITSGITWIVVPGGYKQFREMAGKFNEHVVMSWTGRMLRNLGITRSTDTDAELGFTEETSKQLALYHNVLGAGRGKRLHVFMGFTDAEVGELAKMASEDVVRALAKFK